VNSKVLSRWLRARSETTTPSRLRGWRAIGCKRGAGFNVVLSSSRRTTIAAATTSVELEVVTIVAASVIVSSIV
jgi:hypothetical protein